MKTGLIFDMDGTLWDSSENVAASWAEALRRSGYDRPVITKQDIMKVMGLTMDRLADIIFADYEKDERMKLLDLCCGYENEYLIKHGGILYPELEETLVRLKEKYPLYIVSNCQQGYIEAFLEHFGFGKYFDDIECYGNNLKEKGDNIALVIERNKLERAFYIGDIQGENHISPYNGKKVGSLADMACFSFYPTKNMTTSEGGIITTNDEDLAENAKMFRAHGASVRYHHDEIGYNFRMTDISAAIGLAQLDKIDGFNNKRIENAAYLNEGLKDVDGVITPYCAYDSKHVYHQYTIRVEKGDRDDWVDIINDCGVGTGIHYPIPLYNQPIYKSLGIEGNCPNAELAADNVISLPVHPSLTKEDLDLVIEAVKTASNKLD